MSMRFSFFLLSFLVLFGFAKSDNSKEKEDCAQSLVGLSTCIPYVEGTAKAPTPDCCTGLKQMLKTNLKCLCVIIKDRNDPNLGLKINITLAFNLPQVCNTPANVSQCPALLNLPRNSPDAQVFYQFGNNSNTTSSQGSGGHENSESKPTSAPAINSTSGTSAQQKVAGFCIKSRWLGLILLWAFTSSFVDVK